MKLGPYVGAFALFCGMGCSNSDAPALGGTAQTHASSSGQPGSSGVGPDALCASGGTLSSSSFSVDGGPQLVGMTLSPASVDTSAGMATVLFDLHIVNDQFALTDGAPNVVMVSRPGNLGGSGEYFGDSALISGTPLNGVYRARHTLNRYSPAGTYTVSAIELRDLGGRTTTLRTCDLVARGFPAQFTQTAVVTDLVAPALEEFRVTPATINTADGDVEVTFDIHAVDQGVGIGDLARGQVWLTDPTGNLWASEFRAQDRVSGDALDGWYRVAHVFPRYAHIGFYPLAVELEDDAQNERRVTQDALQQAEMPFAVSNNAPLEDVTAPELVAFGTQPRALELDGSGHLVVTFTLQVTDDLSGLGSVPRDGLTVFTSSLVVVAPDGTSGFRGFGQGSIVDGTPTAGTFQVFHDLWDPIPGTYDVASVVLTDRTGNSRAIQGDALLGAGFATSFVVE